MARFGRLVPPGIVASVRIFDRRADEFGRRHVVQRVELDRYEGATDLFDIAATERAHATVLAEQVVPAFRGELIVAQCLLAGEKPESVGLDEDAPTACLRADRAIALARARREINVRFIAHGPAVAATPVGLQHDRSSFFSVRDPIATLLPPCCQHATPKVVPCAAPTACSRSSRFSAARAG